MTTMRTDTAPATGGTATVHATVTEILGRWWPSLTAALAAVLTVSGGPDDRGLLFLMFTLPVMYLAIAVLDRARTSWLMVGAVGALYFVLEGVGVTAWPVVLVLGAVLVVVGLVRGQLRRPGVFALQIPALLVFGGAGVLALVVSAQVAVVVIALGLLAHATWDAVHWWTRKVISRSLAEWCMVYDTAVGAGILLLLLL
ncbi:hypothetical protein [Nocardiopsis sp. MG754419]|uniref:hypothetical protein n=1 Tax=Nocardiopsis sp. MG754419 TaxID=2259865 RepID=UPI001BAAE6BD|nr:hypothetical protein [Nocardiopsis sp. MG754419]MBR8742513.1 hypothetical protein [Nocardiopsis sp. MG754419]